MKNEVITSKQPLVTIGIVTYNRPYTLRKTVESVINQSYKSLEILISDDCSPGEETEKIINEFIKKDSRVKYIKHKERNNATYNFNYVSKAASGDYFMWLCDDDWIDFNYIENCLKELMKNPEYLLICGKTKFYRGEQFAYEINKINVSENNSLNRVLSFYNQVMGSGNTPNFGLIKSSIIKDMPLRNILGNDYILSANIAFMGKIKTLDNISIHRNLGGISENIKKIALTYKLSLFNVYFPFVSIWLNIVKDLICQSAILTKVSITIRIVLAIKFTFNSALNLDRFISLYRMRFKNNADKKLSVEPLRVSFFRKLKFRKAS